MPNAEQSKGKSKATKAKETHVAAGGAASTADELEEEQEREEQLEKQTQSKIKTRSRFSAAFRSLSKSKGKKEKEKEREKEKEKESKEQSHLSEEQLLVSGAEDVTSIGDISTDSGIKEVAKKKSLTRRLLLGSLKKSKVRPHSLATSDDLSVLSSSRERLGVETSLPSPTGSSSSTLQITISGKKVETVKGKGKGATSETDYLQPTAATAEATGKATGKAATGSGKSTTTRTTTATTTLTRKEDNTSSRRSTKLIVAKVSKEQAAKKKQKEKQKQTQTQKQQTTSLSQLPSALLEEKIVITESTRDTPPRERAPAKPSRAIASSSVQNANSSGAVRKSSGNCRLSLPSRKERELMQEQQQRGHRLNKPISSTHGTTEHPVTIVTALETPPSPEPEPLPPTYPPPPPPPPEPLSLPTTSTIVLVSLSDVEEQTDAVSLAESAGKERALTPLGSPQIAPQVRFAVGSAVRGPAADAYEAALAAAASQQPSSSEEPSDSSLRRLSFAQQQFAFGDHDSIEGRRETVRYQSVASDYNEDSVSEDGEPSEQAKSMPAFGDLTMDQEMEPTIMAPSSEKREHLYKILVIGELGTGKTSFIKRYVHQFFSQNYRATIGVDFALKVLHWDANTIVRLQLWDIAGQERFGNMTRVYYKEAVGAFIVFDVTRSGTFDCVSKWKEDLDSKVQLPDGSPIPCILLANKCDQEKQGIVTQPERMDEYVRENGFAGWFETSAKENINIDEAARALVNKILINDKLITADANDEEKFNLSNAGDTATDGKNKCSC